MHAHRLQEFGCREANVSIVHLALLEWRGSCDAERRSPSVIRERQISAESCRDDTRKLLNASHHLGVKTIACQLRLVRRIRCGRKWRTHRDHMARIEAEICVRELPYGLHHQAACYQQWQRKCDLRAHQDT